MNKELIKQRFGRKLPTYNEHARIQKQMAEKIIKLLNSNNRKFDSILEIGCGTGLLTEIIVQNIEYQKYTALDIVSGCENYIKQINSEILFVSEDIETYDKDCKSFDLIISNAALQWIENLPDFVSKLAKKLNPNGILIFSTFGRENFREIYYTIGKSLPYYSVNELQKTLSDFNPQIEEEIRVMSFKSPLEVLKHIQNTGVNAISSEIWTKKDLIEFESGYNNFCSQNPTLTYNPIYVKINSKSWI